jgi:hypothetical protein
MHFLLLVIAVVAWVLFFVYLTGLAMFLLGVGMFFESGDYIWLIPGVIGAYLMTRSN